LIIEGPKNRPLAAIGGRDATMNIDGSQSGNLKDLGLSKGQAEISRTSGSRARSDRANSSVLIFRRSTELEGTLQLGDVSLPVR
jgi:hypothetical protein